MTDWSRRDTLGVLVVIGATLAAARTLDGVAQALVAAVAVAVASLWIANFLLRGYTDALDASNADG